MHSKRKGNIGQLATALWLSKHGFSVFTEQGDISKIDTIGETNGKIIRFQCKAVTPNNGKINIPLRKCGPGYVVVYKENDLDFFSVYDLDNEKLYLIPSRILRKHKNSFTIRLTKSKNEQVKCINYAEDFLADKILKDLNNS